MLCLSLDGRSQRSTDLNVIVDNRFACFAIVLYVNIGLPAGSR
jgi:hypothetical protein